MNSRPTPYHGVALPLSYLGIAADKSNCLSSVVQSISEKTNDLFLMRLDEGENYLGIIIANETWSNCTRLDL